jgi:ribokinase
VTNTGVAVAGQIARDLVLVIPELPGPNSSAQVTERREMLGGKGANIAVAAAQLGSRVALIGVVGADHTGDWLISQVKTDRIDTTAVVSRPGTTSGLIVDLVTQDASCWGAGHRWSPWPPAGRMSLSGIRISS